MFVLRVIVLFSFFILLPQLVKGKYLNSFVKQLETPDRALAYFALFFGLLVLLQQATHFQQGVTYFISSNETREEFLRVSMSDFYQKVVVVVIAIYWVLFAGCLFAVSALIRGTMRDTRTAMRNEERERNDDVGEVNKKIREKLSKIRGRCKSG